MSKVTEQKEGSFFPQTTSTYRCPNVPCQEETDRQTAKRLKIRDDRRQEDEKRAEQKLQQKKNDVKKLE